MELEPELEAGVTVTAVKWTVHDPDGRYLGMIRYGSDRFQVARYGLGGRIFGSRLDAVQAIITADALGVQP